MMKRCLSLLLAVALIAVLAVPVSAAEGNIGGWIELLETTSLREDGSNRISMTGKSVSFDINTEVVKRLCQIDMLVWHTTADNPTSASVTAGGTKYELTVTRIDNNMSRVYGRIPNASYRSITVTFNKVSTAETILELLSCKVTPVTYATYDAQAYFYIPWDDEYVDIPGNYVTSNGNYDLTLPAQFYIAVEDWNKFDTITITGSVSLFGLNSIRATVGDLGLPYDLTFTQTNASETQTNGVTWNETYYYEYDQSSTSNGDFFADEQIIYGGKVLYTLIIDLSGVDRRLDADLLIYFTGNVYHRDGYEVNVIGAVGTVNTADTSDVTWWTKFTAFMSDLFGINEDSGALDDLGSSSDSISDNASQIHNFEQSQQAVLDNNFAQIQSAVTFTNFAAALVFVQKYTNMTFNGISKYAIIFTLPLFLGLFFYLCSRIPGITRWKTPPPRSKGGGKT